MLPLQMGIAPLSSDYEALAGDFRILTWEGKARLQNSRLAKKFTNIINNIAKALQSAK